VAATQEKLALLDMEMTKNIKFSKLDLHNCFDPFRLGDTYGY
jgi:hypothetical protein